MASSINSTSTGSGGLVSTGDDSGILNIQTNETTAITVDASQKVTFANPIQGGSITSGTAVASTSGTSIDFTSIPSWVKRITVMLNGVSTSGTSPMMVRFGVSGTPETTGYSSICMAYQANTISAGQSTAGWVFTVSAYITAAATVNGQIIFDLLGSNIWVCSGSLYREAGSDTAYIPTGSKTLAGTLNMVRITTTGGTDTFDAGSVNILYEG